MDSAAQDSLAGAPAPAMPRAHTEEPPLDTPAGAQNGAAACAGATDTAPASDTAPDAAPQAAPAAAPAAPVLDAPAAGPLLQAAAPTVQETTPAAPDTAAASETAPEALPAVQEAVSAASEALPAAPEAASRTPVAATDAVPAAPEAAAAAATDTAPEALPAAPEALPAAPEAVPEAAPAASETPAAAAQALPAAPDTAPEAAAPGPLPATVLAAEPAAAAADAAPAPADADATTSGIQAALARAEAALAAAGAALAAAAASPAGKAAAPATAATNAPPAAAAAAAATAPAPADPPTGDNASAAAAGPAAADAEAAGGDAHNAAPTAASTAAPASALAASASASAGGSQRQRYSWADMLGVFKRMPLSQLTDRPPLATEENDPVHGICVAGRTEVVGNLQRLLLQTETNQVAARTVPVQEYVRYMHNRSPPMQRQPSGGGYSSSSHNNNSRPNWGRAAPAAGPAAAAAAAALAPVSLASQQQQQPPPPAQAAAAAAPSAPLRPIRTTQDQVTTTARINIDSFATPFGSNTPVDAAAAGWGPSTPADAQQFQQQAVPGSSSSTNSSGHPPARAASHKLPDNLEVPGWDSYEVPGRAGNRSSGGGSSSSARIQGPDTPGRWQPEGGSSSSTSAPLTAVQPGGPLWQQTLTQLFGLRGPPGSDQLAWLVQWPGVTGSMGPISAQDMAAWLLQPEQGVPPKQLGRAVHKPLLEATAADPAALLVCGLTPAEVSCKPGKAAFKSLGELLPGLAAGLSYSAWSKDNRQASQRAAGPAAALPSSSLVHMASFDSLESTPLAAGAAAASRDAASALDRAASALSGKGSSPMLRHPAQYSSFGAGSFGAGTPTARIASSLAGSASFDTYRQRFAPDTCSPLLLVSQLQELAQQPPHEADRAGLTAAAHATSSRARSSSDERELLVREGAVPPLVRMLQLPLDAAAGGQPHSAAAWALYHLLGRSKAAPQGSPVAQAAMGAADAVARLTAVLKAAWKHGGGGSSSSMQTDPLQSMGSSLLRTSSIASITSTSTTTGSSAQQEAAAGVQEATAAALSALATTPAGMQAMLDAGAVPFIIRLLGSRFPGVVSAAVGALRNLTAPDSFILHRALFKAGVTTMLLHVVASTHTDAATTQIALRILLDLARTAPASDPVSPHASGQQQQQDPFAPTAAPTDDYTADSIAALLVGRGLPGLLLRLLHGGTAPSALQARAMQLLALLAASPGKGPDVRAAILGEYEITTEGQEEVSYYTGVQVLQQLSRSSTSKTVQTLAAQLLQSLPGQAARTGFSRQASRAAGS